MLCANSGHIGSCANDGSTGAAVAGDHVTAELMYAAGHGAANLQWKIFRSGSFSFGPQVAFVI